MPFCLGVFNITVLFVKLTRQVQSSGCFCAKMKKFDKIEERFRRARKSAQSPMPPAECEEQENAHWNASNEWIYGRFSTRVVSFYTKSGKRTTDRSRWPFVERFKRNYASKENITTSTGNATNLIILNCEKTSPEKFSFFPYQSLQILDLPQLWLLKFDFWYCLLILFLRTFDSLFTDAFVHYLQYAKMMPDTNLY